MKKTRSGGWLVLACAAALGLHASCGGAASQPSEPFLEPEPESPVELEHEQEASVEELETALARPEPDCAAACRLEGRICELSERICAIAERHPSDGETADRCRDGRGRCETARERVGETCTCAE